MIDYRINTFLTLCETKNYRITAELLHMTQPAVTQQIQYLEQLYQCRLFQYENRKLHLTQEGELVRKVATEMRYKEDSLKRNLRVEKGHHLRIGATRTVGEYVITSQVSNFLKDTRNTISVEVDNTAHILDLLKRGEIDFALIEGGFDHSEFESRLYKEERFVGFCSLNHPFQGKEVELSRLWDETLIIREKGSGSREILEQSLESKNHSITEFKRLISIGNLGLIKQLTARGCGVTFAYEAAGVQDENLGRFTIQGLEIIRQFNYVYLPSSDANIWVELFESFREEKKVCKK